MFNNIKENPEIFKPKFNFHLSPNPGSKTMKSSILAPKTDLGSHHAEKFSQKSATTPTQQKQLNSESKANPYYSPAIHPPPHSRPKIRKKKVKPHQDVISQRITAFFPPKISEQEKVQSTTPSYKPAQER